MSGERRDHPEQEISIKRRGNELFVQDSAASGGPVKRFSEYLRETPATPLPGWVKAALWALALVAALLFAAALWRLVNRPTPRPPARKARPKASSRVAPRKTDWTLPPAPIAAARFTPPPNQEIPR
ncbi:hypothetical protein [Planctomyces sp. SH-PL62]|uniref:hypothetical protein n=1 Tax=Planctomyces sp. SH-PL62 TaxID=1636152 RepID=UPI00078E5752|nr:hypothetical protein [Planctomyces sp. SH-PL62]AMV40324.1 hypothetical protein VT85_23030 [Planctomyces sp. SH-PL62]